MQGQIVLVRSLYKGKRMVDRRFENTIFSEKYKLMNQSNMCFRDCAKWKIDKSIAETLPQLKGVR